MRNSSLIGAFGGARGCGPDGSVRQGTQSIVGPSPNTQPVVVSVEINGPASIPPGQSAQFTAISRLSDGTSQTPTSVRWSSHTSDSSGCSVSPPPDSRPVKTSCPRR